MFKALPRETTVKLTEEFSRPPRSVPSRPLIKGPAPFLKIAARLMAPTTAIKYALNASSGGWEQDAFLLP
jgi:hypothetical protein